MIINWCSGHLPGHSIPWINCGPLVSPMCSDNAGLGEGNERRHIGADNGSADQAVFLVDISGLFGFVTVDDQFGMVLFFIVGLHGHVFFWRMHGLPSLPFLSFSDFV